MNQMFFYFGRLDNVGVSIFIEEKIKVLRKRPLLQNMFSYHGPILRNQNLQKPRRIRAGIKLEQFIDSELDDSKKCTNYPSGAYASYADCDEAYVKEMMKEHFDNLTPFWTAQNLTDVTFLMFNNFDLDPKGTLQKKKKKFNIFYIVGGGQDRSSLHFFFKSIV